ncbi:MAG: HAMP domain-containing histidine kinase [Hydrogenophilaceae bacterium]|jgi:signal transduction histidine kinase|nr:HAMP domain-containing histidine kinase [Hydrogenophilaceae bacterium]
MRPSLGALAGTTTFRLVAITAAAVILILMAALAGVYVSTVGRAQADADAAAKLEWESLESVYAERGIAALRAEVVERSARQSDMLFALIDVSGETLYKDFEPIPRVPGEDWRPINGPIRRILENGRVVESVGRGRAGRLIGGPVLVVVRDFGVVARIYSSLMGGLFFIGFFGVFGAIAAGLFASQFAARRADLLSRTAQEVKSGDLAKRVPMSRPTPPAGDEFDKLDRDINEMLDEIARLVEATRTAGDSIAHDLRSPLMRLRQSLEAAAQAAPGSPDASASLAKAVEESDKLLDMFNAIISVMRIDSFAASSFKTVDITALANDLAEFYAPVAEDRAIALRARIEAGLSYRGVPEVLTQALVNLLENAINYTQEGGEIELRAEMRPDGQLELAVLDNGPGVPEKDRDRVVQRFVRLDNSRSTPGSGLGLSLVAAVARLHRGVLSLGDGLGDSARPGLRAALILPAAP